MFLYLYKLISGVGMFDFIQKIIYLVLAMQDKALGEKTKKSFKTSYTNSTSKVVFAKGSSLNLTTKTEKNKEKLQYEVKNILKKYENNPQRLLAFVKKHGTDVYRIPFAKIILKQINYEEGLIGELSGLQALYLNLITSVLSGNNINLSLKTKTMFVLDSKSLDNYKIIQQFHKWYAMKLNLPGFDPKSQENFQKFLNTSNNAAVNDLSLDEILGLKEAIARDVEAINFLIDLAKSTEGSKNAMQKITAGGASV